MVGDPLDTSEYIGFEGEKPLTKLLVLGDDGNEELGGTVLPESCNLGAIGT